MTATISNSKIIRSKISIRFCTNYGHPVSTNDMQEQPPTSSGRGSFFVDAVRRERDGRRRGPHSWQWGRRRGWLMLLLIRIVQTGPLVYSVRLKLMIDQVMLGLASFPAHVALRPRLRRRPIRVDIFHVLPKVARRRVASAAVTTERPSIVVAQCRVESREILHGLRSFAGGRSHRRHRGFLPLRHHRSYNQDVPVSWFSFISFFLTLSLLHSGFISLCRSVRSFSHKRPFFSFALLNTHNHTAVAPSHTRAHTLSLSSHRHTPTH